MSKYLLIKHAKLVNEGQIRECDVLVKDDRIEQINDSISAPNGDCRVIDANGKYLLPGVIDDQVHFREPGLTHKGDIASESAAAVAGGITSYIEQPNTVPQATTIEKLDEKYALAENRSFANYGFNLGATNDNIEEILRAKDSRAAGIKTFMGSSTGNMLVNDLDALNRLFSESPLMIITHCEDEETIRKNTEAYRARKEAPKPEWHAQIRNAEACVKSSQLAIELAKKHGSRLHVYHISTREEAEGFDNNLPLAQKKITAEACIHHLWFSDADYATKGNWIKWNPAVKTEDDRVGIWKALLNDRIDVIATDHAPHTRDEKSKELWDCPSGGPLVQHALPAMFEFFHKGLIPLERIVEKMCHNPAILFDINQRGYVREGYYADLVLVHPSTPWTVNESNILYKCGWSPFEGTNFKAKITHTIVNGKIAFENGNVKPKPHGKALAFNRR
jgi:dihydroorotase